MLYCFDSKLPWDYSKKEMQLCQRKDQGILYDRQLNKFVDFEGKEVDIHGQLVFPRTGVSQIYDLNHEIMQNGGIPLVSNEEINSIINWPKYYDSKRGVCILKGGDLIDKKVIEILEDKYGKEIFIKTKEKNFSGVIPTSLLRDTKCVFYKALTYHLEDEFIISENVKIMEDKYGKKEYRCFILNGEVASISRMTDSILHQIDAKVLEEAKEIVKRMKNKFPAYYVVDLFAYEENGKEVLDVVEFNPIHASGPYLYNSAIEKSKDLLHVDIKNLPNEFIDEIDQFKTEGMMVETRTPLYHIVHSFASDIRSIFLIGSRGLLFAADVEITASDLAKHQARYSLEKATPMEDEILFQKVNNQHDLECEVPKEKKLKTSKNKDY